jgi:hypothetical protein
MSRDSILDEAEQNKEKTDEQAAGAEDDSEEERERLTQRVPPDLLEDVERVKEQYHLPSRNATINFMLNAAVDDLLDE